MNFHEIWECRELLYFLVRRDIKALYAQSVLGVGWAIVQPVFSMIVFTVVFGKLARVSSDGIPYAIFSYTALVPWAYFSSSLIGATNSMVSAANMVRKVYFPRIIIPLTQVLAKLVDFAIAFVLLLGMMVWFRMTPTIWVLTLPFLVLLMMLTTAGLGMWFAALAVQYRDVKHAIGFVVQLLMFASPVVYPTSLIPRQYRLVYGLNPMVGVIEGFRSALLGKNPMTWDLIVVGSTTAIIIALSGALYLRNKEKIFADVL
jgi:lipopolysaccharide transport system permease protein